MPTPHSQTAQVQALFVKHGAALRGYVVSLLGDFGGVDDVIHETFLAVTAKAGDFKLGTNFTAWAKSFARFKVIEARRKHWREVPGFSDEALEALGAAEPADDEGPAERELAALTQCIAELAPQTRRAVEARYQQAHSVPETARLLGWTVPSLYVMLCRARTVLRECVERKLTEAH